MKPAKIYHISFDVAPDKRMIEAVAVRLDKSFIRSMDEKIRIDLCDHPLYPALEKYVLANPTQRESS